jgi:hypothetical protein
MPIGRKIKIPLAGAIPGGRVFDLTIGARASMAFDVASKCLVLAGPTAGQAPENLRMRTADHHLHTQPGGRTKMLIHLPIIILTSLYATPIGDAVPKYG